MESNGRYYIDVIYANTFRQVVGGSVTSNKFLLGRSCIFFSALYIELKENCGQNGQTYMLG